jgi:hypothetical protein
MQKNREILAYWNEAACRHLLGRRTHHNPIPILNRQTQQPIAQRTAYKVNVHGQSVWATPQMQRAAHPAPAL